MTTHAHTRQIRLADVGIEGQARIDASRPVLGGEGFVREVERLYLECAGARPVDAARSADGMVAHRNDMIASHTDMTETVRKALRHRPARDVAEGAMRALVSLRRALEDGS